MVAANFLRKKQGDRVLDNPATLCFLGTGFRVMLLLKHMLIPDFTEKQTME
ncbi:MAG: hypothetical protein KJ630_09350 [Proteobacteria bacterium]|nr:hypothetical protein [Pseudomonadota bacterium]